MRPATAVLLVLFLAFACIDAPAAPALRNSDCLDCHADKTLTRTNAAGKSISLFVNAAALAASVHRTNACVSCHSDVTAAHPDDNRPVETVH